MDFLDSTINNCSFASGRSVSLNSSLCHSPTTTTAAFATPTTATTAANRSSHSNRFAPSPASRMSANNNRSQHQRGGSGYQSPAYSPASDRFVSYSDRFLHEEGGRSHHHNTGGVGAAQAVDIFPSPSFGLGRRGGGAATSTFHHPAPSSSQQRRSSLTFSPTRSEMAGSLALRTPLYRCDGSGAAGAEEEDEEDNYLSNTARSIFNNNDDDGFRSVTSPQGAGRASTGGDVQPPTQSSTSFLCLPSSSTTTTRRNQQQNPLLDLYTLEASHQEWSSAIAAATSLSTTTTGDHGGATSGGVSSPLMMGSFRSSTAASSPPRAGGGRQQQQQGSGEGNDHATASDYIRAMEEAAASNGSPHLATAISSPGASAAQAIRSLASGEGPERYISSLANVLLSGHTSSSSTETRRVRGADQEGLCVQSPLNPVKRSQFLSSSSSPSSPHQYPDENAVVLLPAAGGGGGGRQSQASLFASSNAVTYNRNKGRHFQTTTFRTIPQTPERILDAPELVDDFYLNLLDWSAKNVLTVALSNTCYLWNAANGSITQLMTTNAVDNVITAVAWHKVGDVLAIGLSSGEISIWNTRTEKCLHTVSSHTGRVCSLGWHGYLLASGSRDTTVIINHLEGVVEADYRATQQNNNGLSSSGSSSSSSASSPSSPFTGGGVVLQGHTQEVCGLAWSPDGTQLASGGNDNILCIWNVKKDTLEITLGWQFSEHTAAIKAIAWNPVRSHCLVTGGGTADKTLRVWNTHTGVRTHLVDTKSQVCGIVWNNDGTEFVSSHGFSDNQLTIWRFPTMKKLADLTGHTSRVLHLAKSPDGEMVVSAAGDETIRFWRCFAPIVPAEGGVVSGGVRSTAKGTSNPSASAEVQDDAAGEEEEASMQEHASEVAAVVAAVQRDLSRQSRQSRAQHHYQTAPSTTTPSCFGMGRAGVISPTASETTYPSFQRPPATTRPNNTATAVAIEDSVENELLGLTRCISSGESRTTNINYKWASTNNSSLSPIPPHVYMDPTATTISILAADTAASRGGGVPPIQRGSSPLSISSLSPVQHVAGVGAPSYHRSLSPVSDPSSFYIGASCGGTTKHQHQHPCPSGNSQFTHNYSTTKQQQQQQRGSGGGSCTREQSVGGFGGSNSNRIVTSWWDAPPLFGPNSSYSSSNETNHRHNSNNDTEVPSEPAWGSGGGSLLGGFSTAPIGGCR